jgi:hypothetical protein
MVTDDQVLQAARAYKAWLDAGQPDSGLAGSGPYVTDRLIDAGCDPHEVLRAIYRARDAGLVEGWPCRLVVPVK